MPERVTAPDVLAVGGDAALPQQLDFDAQRTGAHWLPVVVMIDCDGLVGVELERHSQCSRIAATVMGARGSTSSSIAWA